MKGMLSKAFSLALLISVVPSFAMDVKAAVEELSPEGVVIVHNAANDMKEATSTVTTLKTAAILNAPSIPSYLESARAYVSSARDYVANSRVAGYATSAAQSVGGYAHSALVAPFNYTLGYLANKSGLADRVSNIGFVKNDSYYSTTIGKYAFGLAAMYAGYKAAKAVYNYATTPATQKAEAVKALIVSTPDLVGPEMIVPTEKEALFQALDILGKKAVKGDSALANSQELNALRAFNFLAANTTHKDKALSLADGVINSDVKSYFALISELVSDLDFYKNPQMRFDSVKGLNDLIHTIKVHFNTKSAATHEKLNFKKAAAEKREASLEKLNAQAKYNPGFITRAYNALVNRRTLIGGATVAGLAAYGYKYGIPFYNTTK